MKNIFTAAGILLLISIYQPSMSQSDPVKLDYELALKVARDLAWNGKYEEAQLLCRRILRDKPEYVDARLLHGNVLAWQNLFEEARNEYLRVFDYDNGNRSALLGLSDVEIWSGNPGRAVGIASTGLENYPGDLELLLKLARAQQLSGDFIGSKKTVYQVLQKDPTNPAARKIYEEIRNSVPVSNEGLSIPGISGPYEIFNVDTLFALAQKHALNQEFGEARRLAGQILVYRPDFYPARVLSAQTYTWENDFNAARAELEKVRVEETGYRDGILGWIDVEKWARNYKSALDYSNLGIRFYPGDEEFILRKAEIYELSGDLLQAKKTLFNYLTGHPNNSRFLQAYSSLMDGNVRREGMVAKMPASDQTGKQTQLDSLYQVARQEAFAGNFEQARIKSMQILQEQPDHFDARFLLGNINAWEQNFGPAREIFDELIVNAFDNYDLILARVNTEMWSQNYTAALSKIQYGLEIYPDDSDLVFKRAMAYQRSGRMDLANNDLSKLLQQDPNNPLYRNAFFAPREPLQINGVSLEYTLNKYEIPARRSFNMLSMRYYRSNQIGTLIGSVNAGYLASDSTQFMQGAGLQFEIDAYPVVPLKKRYFHLNYGFSPSPLFARHRFGAHVYNSVGQGWELSAGFNYMIYRGTADTINVFIADFGAAKYFNDLMVGLNVSLSPNLGKIAQGYTFTLRKFFNTPDDWVQFSIGTGLYPDNPLNYYDDPLYIPNQLLNSYNFLFAVRYRFAEKWIGRIYAGLQYEEYLLNSFRNITNLNLALIYLF